jgi:cytidyltransferase-like protein
VLSQQSQVRDKIHSLDTRSKIVDAVPADASFLKVVLGYFDPLHSGHVRRLRELCRRGEHIGVIVADPSDPVLPLAARAELVAALGCVAYVIPAGRDIPEIPNAIDERESDAQRGQVFAQHVLARHNTR